MPSSLRSVLVVGHGLCAAIVYDDGFTEAAGDFTAGWPELHGRQPVQRRASTGA